MVKKQVIDIILILSMLILYCSNIVDIEDNRYWDQFGLRCVKLNMSEDDYIELIKQEQLNEWVSATLEEEDSSEYVIVRRHGNSSREEPKLSLKCKINNKTIVFSSQYYDTSFCRYRLTDYLFRKANFKTGDIEPILFFINNHFLGLYLQREGIDSTFLVKNSFKATSLYHVNSGGELTYANGMNIYSAFKKSIPKDDKSFRDIEELVLTIDKGVGPDNINNLENKLDVYNALDYYAICVVTNNHDCIRSNYYLLNNYETNKFEFIPWDLDRTFNGAVDGLPQFKNGLFETLLEHEPYEEYFEKRMSELFDKEELLNMLSQYYTEIEYAYSIDPILTGNEVLRQKITNIQVFIDRIDEHLENNDDDHYDD